ncbi:DODA-type extradiol aromatic ring-opening family dioxygenase [Magnetospirillum gryphiswaldense]|uniref:Catalytic LigB subunit of aromatic ring-opening dioxygenase n=1 Tax=Magnetospirillum gryphiswaldense TaxID=55518 RepID=A4TY68_9PROT|nr:class III extradiol ring-cleavage dioxygenase [Magnetospirillum gryphiswaldense]AVM73517.1 LigB family dioxygenase [Magnetospirillum gryphiswaldense MSR-1]AVM77420.1 LigB family dioxygenase [Magnetospirillum gryphiswaldense]CAM75575.1 Catalytic LigB subunit of aromatic ring-opening dioxygenase [Magnetospirillum gryphiswaldense MSR-1]
MAGLKSLFVSHGSPMIALEASPASHFLMELGRTMVRPKAVVAISGHWRTDGFAVGAAAMPETIHDFFGFPPPLYAMTYAAPGDAALAVRVAELTGARLDPRRGLDHGLWTVMKLLWPEADVPVVPLSLGRRLGPEAHFQLGRCLQPLTDQGVLILGSGAATHNLAAYAGRERDETALPWVTAFTDWLAAAVTQGRQDDLTQYRCLAPHAMDNHPTDEHLLPLFVAAGAATAKGAVLHRSVEHGVIAMDAYGWE